MKIDDPDARFSAAPGDSPWTVLAGEVNIFMKELAIEDAARLRRLITAFEGSFGIRGMFHKIKGRALSELLREFEISPPVPRNPVTQGTVHGTNYKLFDSSDGGS